ncbi:hypothetical protein JN757_04715 [Pseudomonas granadensis]|uniref:Uncharacterized protein n=1 Tax=Pseudomonas granadensis TaxID=1421430 RepID=A0ABX7GJI1_9PSED|nr:hypothetical protein [Pseudomonas granadensis]QRK85086.1 hypothetical protein JN757_04715 [Pseudomonas granadensis]
MSRYDTLRERFFSAKSNDEEYWKDLQNMISTIRREFSNFLGVPDGSKVLVDGKEAPPVVIGKLENGKLRLIEYKGLPKKDRSIPFDLQITFDREIYDSPRNYTIFSLSISKDIRGFTVKVDGAKGTHSFLGPQFSELYEHLYSGAVNAIDY